MKRRAILALLLVGLAIGPTPPSEAAGTRTFKQAHICSYAVGDPSSARAKYLFTNVQAGRWTTTYDGVYNCDGSLALGDTWHPTIARFTATVRWYAGAKVIKKVVRRVVNDGRDPGFRLSGKGLRSVAGDGVWKKDGKRITLKVTMSKQGFKARVFNRTSFGNAGF